MLSTNQINQIDLNMRLQLRSDRLVRLLVTNALLKYYAESAITPCLRTTVRPDAGSWACYLGDQAILGLNPGPPPRTCSKPALYAVPNPRSL